MDANALLLEVLKRRASDLHLKMGRPPLFRVAGELIPSEYTPMTPDTMRQFLGTLMDKRNAERFRTDLEVDFSYHIPKRARFRVNVFLQRGQIGVVVRHIPLQVPTIDAMGLPLVLKDIAQRNQGVVLVTGPTGSGKSTTLSAIVDHINNTRHVHVITIEDPVEFVYRDNMATINQRELGTDTRSLSEALKRALRQDPDVILIGELRDRETMETAIHAAETGHLVFSTLHTNDAKQTVDRLLDAFPPDSRDQICKMLALNLLGVLSQRLIKRADGNGRVAALEIMINSPHIQQILEKGATLELEKAIAKSGSFYRMQTFNQALAGLVNQQTISKSDALAASFNPDDLNLLLRGIAAAQVDAMTPGVEIEAPPREPEPEPEPPAPEPPPRKGDDPFKKLKITRGFQF
ncbi:MAG: type IV pilus twitching motility protein PilT [Planctomycetota bacterium]|jgi:twitching motility protein PilT